VRRAPFSPRDLQALRTIAKIMGFEVVYSPDHLSPDNAFSQYFGATDRARFVREYPFRIDASTDDAPFFFEHNRFSRVLGSRDAIFGAASGQAVLLVTLVVVTIFAVLLFFFARRRESKVDGRSPVADVDARSQLYFVAIGLGYIGIELALVPRFVLYLGQPSHALSVVLLSLLCGSALGSALSPRITAGSKSRLAFVAALVAAITIVYALTLPSLFHATLRWSFAARVALAASLVLVTAVPMGVPFPAALSQAVSRGEGSPWVARAWVLNGAASVVASVAVTVLAMATGFTFVLFVAAACYLVAAISVSVRR